MRRFISWNNKRRTWSYWLAIELLLFAGLNISWWLDASNSVIHLINSFIRMTFNLHKVQLFLRSILPIHLLIILVIACVNHLIGFLPDIKRVKILGMFQFYLKSAFLSDILIGISLEEIALAGLEKLGDTFQSTSIALWAYYAIFLIGSILYWKHVFPLFQYIKAMNLFLNGKDYEVKTWYHITNSSLRFSTFNRVPNKGRLTEIIVDHLDLACLNYFIDEPIKEEHFVYYLICIDRSKEISTDFVHAVKKAVNLPHAKTVVYFWDDEGQKDTAKELEDYLSRSKNVRIHDFGRNKPGRHTDIEKLLSDSGIKANGSVFIPFRAIDNAHLMRVYTSIGEGPKLCLDFMKTILTNLDTLPAIYALFDYIDLQYRIAISYISTISYAGLKENSRNIGNLFGMAELVEEDILKPNHSSVSPDELFQDMLTAGDLSLVRKYLPNYEIDDSKPAYETVIYLTASLRNVLRGHGMFEISDANALFSLVLKLALLNVSLLNINGIAMRVSCEKVWREKAFYSVVATDATGNVKNMSPFFVAEPNGNIFVFNNWVVLTSKENQHELTADPGLTEPPMIDRPDEAIEYINYLDGSLITPEFRSIAIEDM